MNTRTALALCLLMTIGVALYTFVVYRSLPDQIPIHWNIRNEVDRYGSKATVLIWPGIMVAMSSFLFLLPWLSPRNFAIATWRPTFNYIIFLVTAMMGYLAVVITIASANPSWRMDKFLMGGILLFLGLLGNMMGKVKKNFYVGIRTPWTLASDKVWDATHRLGGRLMTAAGFLGALAVLAGLPPMPVFFITMAVFLYPVLYSLLLYKRLERM